MTYAKDTQSNNFKISVRFGISLHIHGHCSVMSVKDTNIVTRRGGASNILKGAKSSNKGAELWLARYYNCQNIQEKYSSHYNKENRIS